MRIGTGRLWAQHVHLLVGEAKLVSLAIAMQVFRQRVSRRMRRKKREGAALALISGKRSRIVAILAAALR